MILQVPKYDSTFFSQIQYGNIVDWNKANWNVHNMEYIFANYSSICQVNSKDIVFLPSTEGMSYKKVNSICKGLKGLAYVEDSKSKQDAVALLAISSPYSGKNL